MQDINTIITAAIEDAVERKVKEAMAPLLMRIEAMSVNIYKPDHVMARLSYVEGHVNTLPQEGTIRQMIEDQISESQDKVENMIDDKVSEKLDEDLDDAILEALDSAINDGKISIAFMR